MSCIGHHLGYSQNRKCVLFHAQNILWLRNLVKIKQRDSLEMSYRMNQARRMHLIFFSLPFIVCALVCPNLSALLPSFLPAYLLLAAIIILSFKCGVPDLLTCSPCQSSRPISSPELPRFFRCSVPKCHATAPFSALLSETLLISLEVPWIIDYITDKIWMGCLLPKMVFSFLELPKHWSHTVFSGTTEPHIFNVHHFHQFLKIMHNFSSLLAQERTMPSVIFNRQPVCKYELKTELGKQTYC